MTTTYAQDLSVAGTVWCAFAEREALAPRGFCQFCGSTSHSPLSEVAHAPAASISIRCGSCKGRHASVAGVKSCHEGKSAPPVPVAVPAPARARLNFSAIPDGNYAIRGVDGVVKFYRVSASGAWKNVQVRASDALHRVPGRTGIAILHRIVEAGLDASQMLFATELGRCWMCGKSLTDEVSRARGMGPDCASK